MIFRPSRTQADDVSGLDPATDYRAIYAHLVFVDAAATMAGGLNLAFYRSFTAPRISALLAQTRVIMDEPVRRASDTAVLVWEMTMHGFEHDRGRAALRRMNQIHAAFDIADEDFAYVLSTLVVVPIEFLDRYGWRRASQRERAASAAFYREMGRYMGLRELPETFDGFAEFMRDYERRHVVYTDQARELVTATISLMDHRFPAVLRGAVKTLTSTLMGRTMRRAAGVRTPPPGLTTVVRLAVRGASKLARRRNPHPTHRFPDGVVTLPAYPNGYRIDEIGHMPAAGCPMGGSGEVAAQQPMQ